MNHSAAFAGPLRARFVAAERRLGARAVRAGLVAAGFYESLRFGVKQGWACLLGGLLLALLLLAAAIDMNLCRHHTTWDMRRVRFAVIGLRFAHCRIDFRPWRRHRWMPLLLGFALVALFIWIAENLGTFAGARLYPHQRGGWSPVPIAKFGA
mgnify:FL=1